MCSSGSGFHSFPYFMIGPVLVSVPGENVLSDEEPPVGRSDLVMGPCQAGALLPDPEPLPSWVPASTGLSPSHQGSALPVSWAAGGRGWPSVASSLLCPAALPGTAERSAARPPSHWESTGSGRGLLPHGSPPAHGPSHSSGCRAPTSALLTHICFFWTAGPSDQRKIQA